MSGRKYEQYVVRTAMRPAETGDQGLAVFMTLPPLMFLNGDHPIQGSNQFMEAMWIWADGSTGTDPDRPPHAHDFDEVFLFLGSDCRNPEDLGADVEFILGTADDAETYTINTSSCIFIPKGLMHLPIYFRNVKRPFLMMVSGSNVGSERT